jgi:hypothetical protein
MVLNRIDGTGLPCHDAASVSPRKAYHLEHRSMMRSARTIPQAIRQSPLSQDSRSPTSLRCVDPENSVAPHSRG